MKFATAQPQREPLQTNRQPFRLEHRRRAGGRRVGLFTNILAALVGIGLVVGAVAVSIVVFAVAALAVAVFGGYLWWKTRALRRAMREPRQSDFRPGAVQDRRGGGAIIEGEVIREPRSNGKAPPPRGR